MGILSSIAASLDPVMLMQTSGFEADRWQADLLRSDSRRILVLCNRQAGKSTVAAATAVHEACFRPGSLVLLVSPSLRQSSEAFRKVLEVYRSSGRIVAVKSESALRLELENGSRVVALPAGEETIRGFSGVSLLIIDEAARVPDELYYSVRPMLTVSGGRLIALTTPWGRKGWFYNEWVNSDYWSKIKITALQCPRLTEQILDQERQSMGEAWFRQEYLCEFLDAGGEGFIRSDWVEQCAAGNTTPWQGDPVHLGLDVARSLGGDQTALAVVQGRLVVRVDTNREKDTMATVGRAVDTINNTRARTIRIDDTGVGGGVTDRLWEVAGEAVPGAALYSCEVCPFVFGRRPFHEDRFADLRTEMWWNLGEMLRENRIEIPKNLALFEQLTAPMILNDSRGRLRLESKDSMRSRGIKSPDLADAVAMAVYPDDWMQTYRVGVW